MTPDEIKKVVEQGRREINAARKEMADTIASDFTVGSRSLRKAVAEMRSVGLGGKMTAESARYIADIQEFLNIPSKARTAAAKELNRIQTAIEKMIIKPALAGSGISLKDFRKRKDIGRASGVSSGITDQSREILKTQSLMEKVTGRKVSLEAAAYTHMKGESQLLHGMVKQREIINAAVKKGAKPKTIGKLEEQYQRQYGDLESRFKATAKEGIGAGIETKAQQERERATSGTGITDLSKKLGGSLGKVFTQAATNPDAKAKWGGVAGKIFDLAQSERSGKQTAGQKVASAAISAASSGFASNIPLGGLAMSLGAGAMAGAVVGKVIMDGVDGYRAMKGQMTGLALMSGKVTEHTKEQTEAAMRGSVAAQETLGFSGKGLEYTSKAVHAAKSMGFITRGNDREFTKFVNTMSEGQAVAEAFGDAGTSGMEEMYRMTGRAEGIQKKYLEHLRLAGESGQSIHEFRESSKLEGLTKLFGGRSWSGLGQGMADIGARYPNRIGSMAAQSAMSGLLSSGTPRLLGLATLAEGSVDRGAQALLVANKSKKGLSGYFDSIMSGPKIQGMVDKSLAGLPDATRQIISGYATGELYGNKEFGSLKSFGELEGTGLTKEDQEELTKQQTEILNASLGAIEGQVALLVGIANRIMANYKMGLVSSGIPSTRGMNKSKPEDRREIVDFLISQ